MTNHHNTEDHHASLQLQLLAAWAAVKDRLVEGARAPARTSAAS